jgi:hypothetical protein
MVQRWELHPQLRLRVPQMLICTGPSLPQQLFRRPTLRVIIVQAFQLLLLLHP